MPPRINRHFFYNYCPQSYLLRHLELPSTPPRITQHTTQNYLALHLECPSTSPRITKHSTQRLECPSTSPRITQHSTQNALVRHLELPRTRSWNSLLVKRAPRQKPWKLQREKRLRKSSGRLQSPVSRFTLEFFTEIHFQRGGSRNEYISFENSTPCRLNFELPLPTSLRLLCLQLYRQTGSVVYCRQSKERRGEVGRGDGGCCPFSEDILVYSLRQLVRRLDSC